MTTWLERLKSGLKQSRSGLTEPIARVLGRSPSLDEAALEEIEEILISSDIGAPMAATLVAQLAECSHSSRPTSSELLRTLKEGIRNRLAGCERVMPLRRGNEPTVVLIAGVNGSGKTTTIAKLTAHIRKQNPSLPVTFAAADTFRAAAIEQLGMWADRLKVDLIKHRVSADPSAVVFDALDHVHRCGGILFIDTAGRLQTDHNLMEELRKIERTVSKKLGRGSDERLLVLDATTGQNGISQAYRFHEAICLTGMVLTKFDGTAKGGVIVTIWETLKVPVMYIGVGESKDDLHEFIVDQFVEALFST